AYDDSQEYRLIPKRKLSEAEKQIILLRIEKVKLQRERNLVILNKSIMMFFALMAIAVIGIIQKIITPGQINLFVILGITALIVGVLPYGLASRKEERDLERTIDELTN
ncbi:MAG: hypothetical protein HY515_03345, partial [Candidatus Aenigmarchaeota archaeon]|nr:hypothetical protein [Candidatus Aenigmarchaeota archaeon]